MKLLNDFFTFRELSGNKDTNDRVYRLSLNVGHPIYQAHFQDNPITPGACIIQMLKEITETQHATSYFIRNVKNVKFLIAINPVEHAVIDVHLTTKVEENGLLTMAAVFKNEKTVFCKANIVLEEIAGAPESPELDTGSGHNSGSENNNRIAPAAKGNKPILQDRFDRQHICVVIPTYNNEKTLSQVLDEVLKYTGSVIVVNDGATDSTSEILKNMTETIEVVSYKENRGKGFALKCGFDRAEALGYKTVITLDSDGQHFASDLEAFVQSAETNPGTLLIGQRFIEGLIPSGNSFANRFSNFWFAVHTGRRLQDTQNGFRLYPLAAMKGLRPFTTRYEAELEILVRSAWKGIAIRPVPVHVYYPPESERVTHFMPGKDFFRISLLNTLFTFLAVLYGYPSMLCRWTKDCWAKNFGAKDFRTKDFSPQQEKKQS